MKKRVADWLMEWSSEYGIKECFAVVGGGAMHLDNALALSETIHTTFNHHEQASAMAAEGYARISGEMAMVCVTSGPGGTNTLTGVMGAYQDNLPMLILSGQVRYETTVEATGLPLRYRGTQEFDIIHSIGNMTKYAEMIREPKQAKKMLHQAITLARTGRRGPVWLDVPLGVQSTWLEEEDFDPIEEVGINLPGVSHQEIAALIRTLEQAKRPCILLGSAIRSSGLMTPALQCIEKLGLPVVGGAWLSDCLYEEHPLFYGLSGNIGPRTGNFILQNADVILILGNSLSYKQTGFATAEFAPHAKLIMVDVDAYEAQKPDMPVDQLIHSELGIFFERVLAKGRKIAVDQTWMDYCNQLKARFTPFEGRGVVNADEKIGAYDFWYQVRELEPADSIWVLGNNTGCSAKLQIGVQKAGQRVLTNYNCGSMGYDLPAAIGAATWAKRKVWCATGDGSIMMNLQELQTISHYQLPISIIIFSNGGYGAIRQTCKSFFGGKEVGCSKESGISFPDFKQLARAFGFTYKRCEVQGELTESLRSFMASEERILLELDQKWEDPVSPKVTSRMRADGSFIAPALHDLSPFLTEEELQDWMIAEVVQDE